MSPPEAEACCLQVSMPPYCRVTDKNAVSFKCPQCIDDRLRVTAEASDELGGGHRTHLIDVQENRQCVLLSKQDLSNRPSNPLQRVKTVEIWMTPRRTPPSRGSGTGYLCL